ncbi:Crp/Fnr family transcriptional regulator [Rhodospirillum centenum]|uniref:Transcriptional activator protein Anr n=1 Tax=Rhodospirillum centenum (strain ATCC 51521 / SW) TaxID=414684 RepID=B6IVM8_RHOCS|nr:Crp/Fnr family transcriptional regulator [Rhodospirillum centenum]ACJ00352.1 Transcriptional activator protein Anr [Rhodospirillum centenum SW]
MPPFDMGRVRDLNAHADINPCGACPVRSLTVCAALEVEELRRLAEILQTVRHEAGHTIFAEGDPAETLYNVTAGTMKLYKLLPDGRRQITGFLLPGDFLGLSVNDTYAYSAESVTPVTLCRFPRRRMDALLEEFPKMQRRLFSMASNELAAAQDQMLLLGRKTAKEKICSFLMMLSQRAQRRGHKENPVHVPMSRADIADYLGLTTETVSRTFTQLKTSRVISLLEGNKVQIHDLDQIFDLAEGT